MRGEKIGLGQGFGFFGFAIFLKAQQFGHFLFAAANFHFSEDGAGKADKVD